MTGNPLEEKHSAEMDWRDLVIKRLPKLKKLDGQSKHKKIIIVQKINNTLYIVGVPIVHQEEEED